MDGIPNTPNDAPSGAPRPATVCSACGAEVPPQARFCDACGAEALTPASTEPSAPAASEPAAIPSAPEPAQTAAPVALAAGEGKTCHWCGAVSAPDAIACDACGATFPTPEGDEALERAARARIEDMQAEINKSRGSSWWPFRSR